MRIVFMGTPDIAATCLSALWDAGHEIVAAVTQTDKPKGRGYQMVPPPVKVLAEKLGIPVYQPATLRNGAFSEPLATLAPEVIVVVAYGKILPPEVLSFPRHGCINAHGSLLPKYRGAAPIQRALMEGEKETGITIIQMDDGIDTGDMLLKRTTPITEEDTFETLHDRLAAIAGEALVEALAQIAAGKATPEKQDDALSNYAEKITKEDQIIDFRLPAAQLSCRIRGLSPVPLAMTHMPDGKLLKIVSAQAAENASAPAGTVVAADGAGFVVACGDGTALRVTGVLPEGKGRMAASDFVRGRRISVGDVLAWRK